MAQESIPLNSTTAAAGGAIVAVAAVAIPLIQYAASELERNIMITVMKK